ncbi:chitinase [Olleya phage Harreka_1]|uniref:Chitinase n=1 Tax=Olleya phage Harreka_1 TaxID=2745673 RepID=A0A8E4ZJ00_9CAUD|nr:endolysin [Olleya phage Harreka_1]QQV90423.1 chitinase [Olleya phage Harreka_1]
MRLQDKYKTLLSNYGINTPLRIAHFMAQIHHESNLKPVSENLNYSKSALRRVFGKYFKNDAIASQYARQPEKIANKVYANRMLNGNEASGDGWKYRGRGFIQITGKQNYMLLSKDMRVDYLNNPELLLNEADSMISAVWYWNKNNLNKYADRNDIKTITKKINGGYNGLEHRTELLNKYLTN